MAKNSIRKKNKLNQLKNRRQTTRRLPYNVQIMKGGSDNTCTVLSFNVLARLATHYNHALRDMKYLDSMVESMDQIANAGVDHKTINAAANLRKLRPSAKPYEHIVDTARRFEKIKSIILAESQSDVVFLQEIDTYLFRYLMSETDFNEVYDGYYRFPPIGKPEAFDLFLEFGTAIFWKKNKYTAELKLPLDYLSYGLFNSLLQTSEPFDPKQIDYPDAIGINTKLTIKSNNTPENDKTAYTLNMENIGQPNKDDAFIYKAQSNKDAYEKIATRIFTYPTSNLKHVTIDNNIALDDIFGKKPGTFVRLKTILGQLQQIDLVCLHLNWSKKQTNPERELMLKFTTDFLNKVNSESSALTVIGGDFNLAIQPNNNPFNNEYVMANQPNNENKPTTFDFDYGTKSSPAWIDHMFYKVQTPSDNKQDATSPILEVLSEDSIKIDAHTRIFTSSKEETDKKSFLASDHYPIKATFTF